MLIGCCIQRILLRLLRAGVAPDQLEDGLDHRSGLLGVADTADMRELLEREAGGDERAALALDLFIRRTAEGIAAAATALPRVGALVFTGGIGEHAAPVRERVVGRLGSLGFRAALTDADEDAVLTPEGGAPAVVRVAAREDLVIAEATRSLLA